MHLHSLHAAGRLEAMVSSLSTPARLGSCEGRKYKKRADGCLSDVVDDAQEFESSRDRDLSCFRRLEVEEHVTLLPWYLGRVGEGVVELLNSRVLRYSRAYGGVLLSYSRPIVLQRSARILDEQPHLHFDLKYTAYVFRPVVGGVLRGRVNNVGVDHLGCLVYECFNATLYGGNQGGEGGGEGWNPGAGGLHHALGSSVAFRVVRLDVVGRVLSIFGRVLCDHDRSSGGVTNEGCVSSTSCAPIVSSSDGNKQSHDNVSGRKRKRKHMESSPNSSLPKHVNEDGASKCCGSGQSQAMAMDCAGTSSSPKKKKKKRK